MLTATPFAAFDPADDRLAKKTQAGAFFQSQGDGPQYLEVRGVVW